MEGFKRGSPLQEGLFVPWLKRLISHYSPRHLLVLLVDGLLREDGQFGRIVAFKAHALAIQLSDLAGEAVSHENDEAVAHRCRKGLTYIGKDVSLGIR